MNDEYQVEGIMDHTVGRLIDHSDRSQIGPSLCLESYDGQRHANVTAAMEEDDEQELRDFLMEEDGSKGLALAEGFIRHWQRGEYRAAAAMLEYSGVSCTLESHIDIREWADAERHLDSYGFKGIQARLKQAGELIRQAGELLRGADAIAMDVDPHYYAAAYTVKTVSLCDQLRESVRDAAEMAHDCDERDTVEGLAALQDLLGDGNAAGPTAAR
ncbi:hypothetical protein BISA_2206 [Bifidobacterium saguini DSM 23967]|uniref:Uncharacterized protein n=2 Tax=Bifidobacterium saguini TaxID=762210 RepID=A0A087D5N4_9BIFI|nr:hypothetical protein [Bifidobacterium saguini]KFI90834.1 hypothetical protein BISA_2206 [Bifidobacterium saguini DSM 23967]QTB90750.1 hypothetical protein BSD967_10750 [Bifidobacterium saguini]